MPENPPAARPPEPRLRFISEAVQADGEWRTAANGEPGLPEAFLWRGERLVIQRLISTGSETGACTHGSGERYRRRHRFRVELADHRTAVFSFERRPPRGRHPASNRWWLVELG